MADPRADPTGPESSRNDRWRALFEARAALSFVDHARARLFFLQLDAWSHPQLVTLLRDPAFVAGLSPAAQRRFLGPPLAQFPLRWPQSLRVFAEALYDVVRTRAEYLLEGREETPSLDLSNAIWEPHADGDTAHAAIAAHLRAIVELHFGVPTDFDQVRDAFALFASGSLALLDGPPTGTDPVADGLNGEPDSAYFFCFGELALQAAERASRSQRRDEFWWQFAAVTIAAQEFFLAVYCAGAASRSLTNCVRAARRPCPELTLARMRERMAELDPPANAAPLAVLARRHAENILAAGRDEFLRTNR
jgi:hypothetical protein